MKSDNTLLRSCYAIRCCLGNGAHSLILDIIYRGNPLTPKCKSNLKGKESDNVNPALPAVSLPCLLQLIDVCCVPETTAVKVSTTGDKKKACIFCFCMNQASLTQSTFVTLTSYCKNGNNLLIIEAPYGIIFDTEENPEELTSSGWMFHLIDSSCAAEPHVSKLEQ